MRQTRHFSIPNNFPTDIEYKFCNDAKPTTRTICRQSCLNMNKEGETGWDLAVIPTLAHNNEVYSQFTISVQS